MQVTLSVNVLYLQRGGDKLLVDAGKGTLPILGNPGGTLLDELAAICVEPDDITHILLSHAHWDHIGAMFRDGAALTGKVFRNAKVCVPSRHVFTAEFVAA
jgi:glyoxylase-like metal-dependent hydrolase (beta-lactamase superfamily II)